MATHSLRNGIPLGTARTNRRLLFKRDPHYSKDDCEDNKTKHYSKYHHEHHHKYYHKHKYPKDSDKPKKGEPEKPEKPPKSKEPPKSKKPPEKPSKKPPKKYPEKKPPVTNPPGGPPYNTNPSDPGDPGGLDGPPDGNNPGGNGPGGNNPPGGMATSTYQDYQSYPTSSPGSVPTAMPNALPSEQNRPKLSIEGISIITAILFGVVAMVALAIYRKRSSLRQRGAVRLEDYDNDGDSVEPRFLSMSNIRSLRIPSMPPKVQLTRLSSATILFPFRNSTTQPLNDNLNNNNLNNNGYLSPYTKIHDLSGPDPTSSGRFTLNDYNDYYSQKTDSLQSHPSSHESYTSLESSFPVPPRRIDRTNSTPTSATFGDMYDLKVI